MYDKGLKLSKFFLLLYGIDIKSKSDRNSNLKQGLIYISIVICHVDFLFFIVSCNYFRILNGNQWKKMISNKFIEFGNIFMWYILYSKRYRLEKVLRQIDIVGKKLGVLPPTKLLTAFIIWLVIEMCVVLTIGVYFGSENAFFRSYFTLTFYDPSKAYFEIIYHVMLVVYSVSAQPFQSSVCCFYAGLCCYLHAMLEQHLKVAKRDLGTGAERDSAAVSMITGHYDEITSALRALERALSVIALCFLASVFTGVFLSIYHLFETGQTTSLRHWHLLCTSMAKFVAFCYFAISINETDREMKQVLAGFVKRGLYGNRKALETLRASADGEPFSLSAWGFFSFTKSFLVATFGSTITYMLILLKL